MAIAAMVNPSRVLMEVRGSRQDIFNLSNYAEAILGVVRFMREEVAQG